ncbi:MAG: M20/M25/M40 family metallo-hydrolase [Tissierellia bacterium]|nr:M20/M25/M40 family metallo-hydrolase [Tissierellia bacterium]
MKAIKVLQDALKFKTISYSDYESIDYGEFTRFLNFLEESFPLVHNKMEVTRIEDYNLLLKLKGQKEDLLPYLFIAHYDVVPATDDGWPYPAFSGALEEDKVWGRGAIDDKGSLISLMVAMEQLLEEGFESNRDIYFAFGFDEEVGGEKGAARMAAYLKERGIYFDSILDEGGAVSSGDALGIDSDVAVVGFAEKGNTSLRFTFTGDEGHSSAPPKETSISKMAAFIRNVQASPRPSRLTPEVEAMLKNISDYKSGAEKLVLKNPSRYFFILKKILEKNKQTASMIRTTVAFTMCEGGTAHNVLPRTASCVANVRMLPGDKFEDIVAYFSSFGHDYCMEILNREEGSGGSSDRTRFYLSLKSSINKFYPETLVTPYLVSGGTDSRHYEELTSNIYRFLPYRLSADELATMHGRGEYLSVENYKRMIEFYKEVLKQEKANV